MSSKKDLARRYFLRIQMGHLHEALLLINKAWHDPEIKDALEKSSHKTIEIFNDLLSIANHKDQHQYLGRIRDNIAFHYHSNSKLIGRAMKQIDDAGKDPATIITWGDHIKSSHYEAADLVVDRIVTRQIWLIGDDEDVREKSDEMVDLLMTAFGLFVQFSSEFIWDQTST